MLGEELVQSGKVTPEEIQEAISWQVLYGGRLGTNLMELGIISEESLAEALGKHHRCEYHFGDIFVDELLARRIPKALAERAEMVPFRKEKARVEVLCSDPRNIRALDEISFSLGAQVIPVVVPQHRLWTILRRIYKTRRPMRALDFKVPPLRPRPGQGQAAKKHDEGPEMISEEEFNFLYGNLAAPAPAPPAPPPAPAAPPPLAPPVTVRAAPPPRGAAPGQPPPGAALPAGAEEDEVMELPEDALILEGEVIEEAAARAVEVAIEEAPAEPPPDLSPLTFSAADELLKTVTDREQIARIVLRYAISVARRGILLAVQGPLAVGWDALGEGLEPDSAHAVALPLSVPSAFHLAVKTRAHYLGPFRKEPGNLQFIKCLGRSFGVPKSVLIMPILVNRRVSHLLYLDGGKGGQAPTDVGEVLILAQKITRSVDALIASRQVAKTPQSEMADVADVLSAAAPASVPEGKP